jgi:hypothetical protein
MILMMPAVQSELKLSSEQITKLKALVPHRRRPGGGSGDGPGGGPGGPGGQGGQGGPPMGGGDEGAPPPPQGDMGGNGNGDNPPPPPPQNGGKEMDEKIKSVLSSAQFSRYQQLNLQMQGVRSMMRPEVSEQLGLSDDQLDKIAAVFKANRPPRPRQDSNPQDMRKQMDSMRAKVEAQVLAVLTSDQKSKWSAMLGKHFDFPRPPRPAND